MVAGDPLLRMAGLPGMRSLGNGPLPDDGVDRTPTERYLYNTRESYDSKGWSKHFLSSDGRVRYLERSNLAPLSTNNDTFLGLPCDHKDEWYLGKTHWTSPSITRLIPCGQKMLYYFNGNGCSPDWLLKGLMLLPWPLRETIYEHTVRFAGLLNWVTANDVSTYPVKINNGSQNAKDVLIDFLGFLSTRVVWCVKCCNQPWKSDLNNPIVEEVLKSPLKFSWVRAFRELRIEKVDVCPMLTKLGESDASRREGSQYAIDTRTDYFLNFHHERLGLRSLLLNDANNERELITHILTPGSKLWGYTDDIDDDAYISLQYMESWLSYTDDIADDAYMSLQIMEGWNEKPHKPRRFRIFKKIRKLLSLQ
ncbi:hypothetical protein BOTCAL_0377g00010 [Botryotinia calthae]|uniref:Uncharacterized protein n=1 Tax=Botryotinia calthae TaxID=38488 RepID=A0A4Y8CSF4_9HELO|nr:hypothetical protein BOTCAL_0377g00010 [Botryotinia calthae]